MIRHLLSTIRIVDDRAEYFARWQHLRAAVHGRGGNAWIFVADDDPARFIEFIEWKQAGNAASLLDDQVVRSARAELDRCGSGSEQHWKEAEHS